MQTVVDYWNGIPKAANTELVFIIKVNTDVVCYKRFLFAKRQKYITKPKSCKLRD